MHTTAKGLISGSVLRGGPNKACRAAVKRTRVPWRHPAGDMVFGAAGCLGPHGVKTCLQRGALAHAFVMEGCRAQLNSASAFGLGRSRVSRSGVFTNIADSMELCWAALVEGDTVMTVVMWSAAVVLRS